MSSATTIAYQQALADAHRRVAEQRDTYRQALVDAMEVFYDARLNEDQALSKMRTVIINALEEAHS